jgi:two-component system OmpR family response regulator
VHHPEVMGFVISWPFARPRGPSSHPGAEPTLLVLEDDRNLRAALVSLFARHHLLALLASDGTAVIRQLTRCMEEPNPGLFQVDTVVADVDSPGRSGLDILAIVRARRWPVRVVLTARVAACSLRAEVLSMGAAGLLERPLTAKDWDRVLRAIRTSSPRQVQPTART